MSNDNTRDFKQQYASWMEAEAGYLRLNVSFPHKGLKREPKEVDSIRYLPCPRIGGGGLGLGLEIPHVTFPPAEDWVRPSTPEGRRNTRNADYTTMLGHIRG